MSLRKLKKIIMTDESTYGHRALQRSFLKLAAKASTKDVDKLMADAVGVGGMSYYGKIEKILAYLKVVESPIAWQYRRILAFVARNTTLMRRIVIREAVISVAEFWRDQQSLAILEQMFNTERIEWLKTYIDNVKNEIKNRTTQD